MHALDATTLSARINAGEAFSLIDVREPWEFAICRIPGAINLPLGQLPGLWNNIDTSRPVVAICHHGVRSLRACHFLASQGLTDLYNLTGGIDAWAEHIDPTMERY